MRRIRLNNYRTAPWLVWLGAVVLFTSWLSQNYFEAERQGELTYLNQAQLLISIEEGHFSRWFGLLLVEQAKSPPNQEVLRDASLKAAQHQLNILTWATARVTDPATHARLLEDKNKLQEKLRAAHEKADTKALSALLNTMTAAADKHGPVLIEAFTKRYNEARNAQSFWRKVFLVSYVGGLLLTGFGAFLAWQRGLKASELAPSPNMRSSGRAKKRRVGEP